METRLQQEVNKALRVFPEYWQEDILLKNKLIEDVRSYNEKVIEALLSNKLIKNTYSLELPSGLIFKIEDFISMLRFKNYWDNSYTKYTNEVGLTSEGKYLKYNTDVVLDFPHKDSVLEGGMAKEDIRKKEIYYHNVIAKEEIDTLLSPKVFANVKKYDKNGEHDVKIVGDKENLIIKGNNLIALHSLKKKYAEKIDLIYIDPPYNVKSSNNTFLYNNKYNRSSWLVFMQNRLEAAKKLLTKDGAIIITIDENEQAYLGVLIDEIFPYHDKHLITIVHNPRGVQGTNFSYTNEFAYFIIPKNKKTVIDKRLTENEISWSPLRNWGGESRREDAKNCFYPIIVKNDEIVGFGDVSPDNLHPEKNEVKDGYTYVYPIDSKGVERKWRYARQTVEQIKDLLRCVKSKNNIYDIQIGKNFGQFKTVWQDSRYDANNYGKQLLGELVPDNPFTFPKSVYAVYDCLYAVVGNKKDATILDFFAGSGSTAHATILLNKEDGGRRNYILVEQMDYVQSVIVERMKNLMHQSGLKDIESDFVYFELMEQNQSFIRQIEEVSDETELSNLLNAITEKAFLNFKVDLEKMTSDNNGFHELSLKEQKDVLIQVLDMNQLYLNYSEIEDSQYDISDSVKAFNHSFYQKEGNEGK